MPVHVHISAKSASLGVTESWLSLAVVVNAGSKAGLSASGGSRLEMGGGTFDAQKPSMID